MQDQVEKIEFKDNEEYLEKMKPTPCKQKNRKSQEKNSETDSYLLAWQEACENRKFEIEMYWKRATYFWAFIVSIYTAFFAVLTSDIEKSKIFAEYVGLQEVILCCLALLGFIFCLAFLLQSIGSKQWQQNWETHVDLLENKVVGPLYKTFVQNEHKNFSVSKINELLCLVLTIFSFFYLYIQVG